MLETLILNISQNNIKLIAEKKSKFIIMDKSIFTHVKNAKFNIQRK